MTQPQGVVEDPLLTPSEVARMFRVDPKTVTRWCKGSNGRPPKLQSVRTPGGHHRIRMSTVQALLEP